MKIKIKTCELSAANLDWAVAKIEGCSKKLLMNHENHNSYGIDHAAGRENTVPQLL